MPRNRKCIVSGKLYEITFRTEQGLPLIPNHVVNRILLGILAKAQHKYPVHICNLLFMSNHVHMHLVPICAQDTILFILYLKTESASAINRFMGRKKRTIWAEGYDCALIGDIDKAIERIVYIYTNPTAAGLVSSIEQYPGINSWRLRKAKTSKIARNKIPKLPAKGLSNLKALRIKTRLNKIKSSKYTLRITPEKILECFEDLEMSNKELESTLLKKLRIKEKELVENRVKEKKTFLGAKKLKEQRLDLEHEPKKFGKRMICFCSNIELRKKIINWFKELSSSAKYQYKKFKEQKSMKLPAGMFFSGGLLSGNLLTIPLKI